MENPKWRIQNGDAEKLHFSILNDHFSFGVWKFSDRRLLKPGEARPIIPADHLPRRAADALLDLPSVVRRFAIPPDLRRTGSSPRNEDSPASRRCHVNEH